MKTPNGLVFGFLGVLCFSLTLPATRFAVVDIDPTTVGLGRALIAALLASFFLWFSGERLPNKKYWFGIVLVSAGGVIGFPVMTSIAMTYTHASHGAVVLGLLPLFTAIFAVFFCDERPSFVFWLAGLSGSALVVGYTLTISQGGFVLYDILLLFAAIFAGLAYAVGARLSSEIGSWQVICWALLFSVPFIFPIVTFSIIENGFTVKSKSLFGFLYVSFFSMFLAFFFWYRGLALGGVAKIGLLQLLQPFLTIGFSILLLGEAVSYYTLLVCTIVSAVLFVSFRSRVTIKNNIPSGINLSVDE
jgi:drug/metabolite transporter (DMT)-like permease